MARPLPTSSYAVLGLLSMAPMSGYDLAQAADRSIANFYPISKTQAYAELGRLEGLGLISGREVSQERLPDKRLFELSPAGEEVLDSWLANQLLEADFIRLPSLLKVFFGHRVPRDRLAGLLDEFHRSAEARVDHLTKVVALLGGTPDAGHARMAATYGLRMAQASAAWADEVRSQLPPAPRGIDPRRSEAPETMRLFREVPPRPPRRSAGH